MSFRRRMRSSSARSLARMPEASSPPFGAAARTVLFFWAAEVALARLSSDQQSLADLALSLALLLALGLLPVLVVGSLPVARVRLRAAAFGLAGALPGLFVCAGVIFAAASVLRPRFGPMSVLALTLVLVGWRVNAALRYQRPISRPVGSAVLLAAVTVLAWRVLNGAFAPLLLTVSVLAAYLACAALASRPRAAWALLLLAPLCAIWPERAVRVEWSDAAPQAAATAPDVVLLCVDTLRLDAARAMQSYQRLAAEGVEFTRAQAAGPWTLPSMATVMTGLPPWSHAAGSGEGWRYVGLPFDVPVLAEQLCDAGYDTAALVHNPVCSEAFGFARGFTVWDAATTRSRWSLPRTRSTLEARPFAAHLASALQLWGRRPFFDAEDLATGARAVLKARREEQPLLLWLHFLDCHFPYREAANSGVEDWQRRMELERGDAHAFRADPWWRSEEGRESLRRAYDAEIARVDRSLLEVLDALGPPPARGRVVVLFSDHGEEFFEHGGIEHGHALWQELLAVPLVITGLPGRAAGSVESAVVGHQDLLATVLAAANQSLLPPTDEASRSPGRDLAKSPLVELPMRSENLLRSAQPWNSEWSVRFGDRKLVFGPEGVVGAFDLAADPAERVNLAEAWAEFVAGIEERPGRVTRRSAGGDAAGARAMVQAGYVGD